MTTAAAPVKAIGKFAEDCMARRIKHHMEHLSEHSGGQEQAIAIAAHE